MATGTIIRLPAGASTTELPSTVSCDLAAPSSERQKALRDLLQAHHSTAAPLRNPSLLLHSHMPHILCSALDLGHDAAFLKEAYNAVIQTLVEIDSTFVRGDKIEKDRLEQYFHRREYTVAFVDFFDEEFQRHNGNWKKVVEDYLFTRDKPLMNGLVGGLGHPIIHLAYAYDFGIAEVASEGLSLLCTDYSEFHDLLDDPPPDTATYKTDSLAEVLARVHNDTRFDDIVKQPGIQNAGLVMEKCSHAVLEHWNAWEVTDPLRQLEHICDVATLIALSTSDEAKEYDFYLIHLLTMAQAIRSLWLRFPIDRRAAMLREYAIMAISTYICQQRPPLDIERIQNVAIKERDWNWAYKTAREHPARFDVHFFKVVRAPRIFEETYGAKDGFYLKAVLKFLDEFRGWTGFGSIGEEYGFDPKHEGYLADS